MTAREKFKIGDRVRLNAAGLAHHTALGSKTPTTGRVTGFARSVDSVRILRDGRLTSLLLRADWWDVDEPRATPLDRAARKLITALYLYPGHRVDSRGPAGCIVDALEEIAPEVAAELREGDAREVYQRRWGDLP